MNEIDFANKILSETKMPPKKASKVPKKKKTVAVTKSETKSSGTQIENPNWFGWKEALEKVAAINLNTFPDQDLDKINDFCEKLKSIISEEQVVLLKRKQLGAELQSDLVIKFAIEYLHRYKLTGFAQFLQKISEQIGTLVYELSSEQRTGQVQLVCPKKWMDLNEVLETVFKAEKDTVEVFGKLYPLLQKEPDTKLITMKISIIEQFEELMDLFQSAKSSQDVLEIDKKLGKHLQ